MYLGVTDLHVKKGEWQSLMTSKRVIPCLEKIGRYITFIWKIINRKKPNKKQLEFERSWKKENNGKMYIIVGLGNPSFKYVGTRHNVGFETIDTLAHKYNIQVTTKKHRALIGKGIIEGHKVILVKPQTFMNLSGESVRSVVSYYNINEEHELIVIFDDVNLDVGQIRIRERGSAGGQNGVKSIIAHLGTSNFIRVRIGIGTKPPMYKMSDYVLSHFVHEEREIMDKCYDESVKAIVSILDGDIHKAMNQWNQRKVN